MALNPDSEQKDLASPEDYRHDHPTEHPEMWGWHGEWGKWTPIAGIIVAAVLLLMMTATHYNAMGILFLGLSAAIIVLMVIYDLRRRRNAWRK